jgi:predicted methyltransferase
MKPVFCVLLIALMLGALVACQPADETPYAEPPLPVPEEAMEEEAAEPEPETDSVDPLAAVLDRQPEDIQARFAHRNPQATLNFFGIAPGMTVVEALPGGGWYTRILLPYLGEDGKLIAANYPATLFEQFEWATEEFLEGLPAWPERFARNALDLCAQDCAPVDAFWLGQLPADWQGTADAVLFIRVLQNLARFQHEGIDDYLDQAFADAYAVLKPGGVLGIVQHEAREDMPDEWATGAYGYLKKSFVIAQAEAAGFELVEESAINENPADRPTVEDSVWRLPPTLGTSGEDAELRAEMEAIGESHRMTLKFIKPASAGY